MRAKGQEERLTALNATYQQEQEAQQQQITQLTDSIAELKAYNHQMKERETTIEMRRERVRDAISRGKLIIEKTMRDTKIDQHLDTLSNLIYLWPDFTRKSQSGFRAAEAYLKQIKSSFDDSERTQIANDLNQHCAAIIDKWNNKIVELSR